MNATTEVSTPVAMRTLKIVPTPDAPPLELVPQKFPEPSLTSSALGAPPMAAPVFPVNCTTVVSVPELAFTR